MKAIIILNYASEEDVGKKTTIRLRNDEYEWIEEVVIKPMPEKIEEGEEPNIKYGISEYAVGRNDCIDEIIGETE